MHDSRLDWAQRRKVPVLERDLAAIVPQFDVRRLGPPPAPLPRLPCLAKPWNVSMCSRAPPGGQNVARHLESVLGLRPDNGAAFFQSYSPSAGRFWFASSSPRASPRTLAAGSF
jgi:heme oxygenase